MGVCIAAREPDVAIGFTGCPVENGPKTGLLLYGAAVWLGGGGIVDPAEGVPALGGKNGDGAGAR